MYFDVNYSIITIIFVSIIIRFIRVITINLLILLITIIMFGIQIGIIIIRNLNIGISYITDSIVKCFSFSLALSQKRFYFLL